MPMPLFPILILAVSALAFAPMPAKASGTLKGQLYFTPGVEEYRLLVKFRAEAGPQVDAGGSLTFANAPGLRKSPADGPLSLRYRRVLDPETGASAGSPPGSLGKAVAPSPFLAQFAGLMQVDLPGADRHALRELGEELESLDVVEYAVLEPLAGPPPPGAVDIAPPTPAFYDQQDWLGDASTNGMDCRYAWTRGATGLGVRVFDIEDSWGDLDHEDFAQDSLAYGRPRHSDQYADHGIAVFGAIFGQHNDYGIDGCAPHATGRAYSFQNASGPQSRPETLVMMGNDACPGDVILIEMQSGGLGGDNLAPADVNPAVWDATRAATDKGVVVIGTAGNGSADLDGSAYADYRARGDNGVIMVSGGNSATRARNVGSYGECCVHVQGWGHNVTTTGYGGLFNPDGDIRQSYTATFSGTSSAGAVVAGAAAALQSHALQALGRPLQPREMRTVLVETGRPHTGSAHIGPLPDLRAAILRIDSLAIAGDTATPPPPSVNLSYGDDSIATLHADSGFVSLSPLRACGARKWSVSPPLPSGLELDTASGVISGTPAGSSASADYTITASNAGGTSSTVVRIEVDGSVALREEIPESNPGTLNWSLEPGALRLDGEPGRRYRIVLADAGGKVHWRGTFAAAGRPERVFLQPLPPGMYFLSVRGDGGTRRVEARLWMP